MATCDNCGHNQSDFLSTDDIEAIQLRSITLDGRCSMLENENASLKAMLKTQSDHHQTRVQELLSGFEDGLRGIKQGNEVEGLRGENEILKSSVFELNLKLKCSENLINDLKAQLASALAQTKIDKELIEDADALISELEDRLKEAHDFDDKSREMSSVRSSEDDSETINDMILQKQLEESFGNSLERIKNRFNSTKGSPFDSAEDSPMTSPSKELSSVESSNFSTSSVLMPVLPTTAESHGTLTNMVKEASNETANDESDIVVVDMTDEIRDLVF
jgi:hypothetical protein